jgi:cytochrome P450
MLTDDVELAQRLSRERPHDFTRGGRVRPVTAEMGFEGLFSVEGAAWAPQRRLIMQALNATHFRGWTADLLRTTDRLAARWDRAVAAGGRTELLDDLRRYTVDVTSTLAFGQDTDTLSGGEDVIQRQLAVIFPAMMKRVMTPFSWWHWVRLPEDRRVDRALSAVHAHARAWVERARRALPGADPAAPRHALEALLQQQSSLGLRDEDVIANVITLLLAGEDTTAHALAWTAFHLAQAPALQATWAARARAALGPEGRCTQAGQLQALEGLEHLAWEAMRLHPVVPFNVFEPVRDTEVGGVAVAAGTKICFVNRPALTDPSRFPDPLAYRPERWVDPAGHDPRAFLQFGAGPRVCPGRHLATLEIRLVLGTLLARHAWTLDTPADRVREVNAFTMHPDRLPVRLVPRP